MTKRTSLVLAIAVQSLLLQGGDASDRDILPALSSSQVRAIIDRASGERALNDIRRLALIHRWFVSPGYEEAATYVMNEARRIGLEGVAIDRFPANGKTHYATSLSLPRWSVARAELRMTAPEPRHLISWDEMPTCLASNSRSAEVEAELIDVGEGIHASDYEGKDVAGKLVLASSPQGKGRIELVHRLAVLERGAAGVVSYRSYYPDDFPDLVTWDHLFTLEKNGRKSTFGFCVSKRLGWELKRRLRNGEKVVLRADIQSELSAGEYEIVEGTIPGRDWPEQEVWFIAHLDHARPGANDNASGSAAILECARAFRELIDSGAWPGPRRTLRFLWVPEIYGTYAYLVSHPRRVRRAVAVINLDMVGENQALCGSEFQVTRTPDSVPSYINDILSAGLELLLGNPLLPGHEAEGKSSLTSATGTHDPWRAGLVPYSGGSDHEVFLGGGLQVPATMFGSWPDYFYHTNQDTPDKCDSTQLRRAIVLAMISARSIADMNVSSALEFLGRAYAKACQRTDRDFEKAMATLRRGGPGGEDLKEALNIVDRGVEREEATLTSILALFPGEERLSRAVRHSAAYLAGRRELGRRSVLDSFAALCVERKIGRPRPPAGPTPEEKEAERLIPCRDPRFPGPLSDDYIALKLEAKGIPYRNPFSEVESFEIAAFIDGKRTVLGIRNAVSAECGPVSLADVLNHIRDLESAGVITAKMPDR
jgi:aminopeptidase YwaD